MNEYETFYDNIKELSNGVLRITIPDKLAKFGNFKAGDVIKVMIQKADVESDDGLKKEE